jgi:hypothetical protein
MNRAKQANEASKKQSTQASSILTEIAPVKTTLVKRDFAAKKTASTSPGEME